MLTPRFGKLRARHKRDLRQWAIDLSVVVIGVLLALWAAEWADGRREAEEDRRIMAQVREEIRANLIAVSVVKSQEECWFSRVTEIQSALQQGNGQFRLEPQFPEGSRRPGPFDDTIKVWVRPIMRDQFGRAVAAGTLERVEHGPELRQAYFFFDQYRGAQDTLLENIGELRALGALLELPDSQRAGFMRVLAKVDEAMGLMNVIGSGTFAVLPDRFTQLDADSRSRLEQITEAQRRYQGPCVQDVVWPVTAARSGADGEVGARSAHGDVDQEEAAIASQQQ